MNKLIKKMDMINVCMKLQFKMMRIIKNQHHHRQMTILELVLHNQIRNQIKTQEKEKGKQQQMKIDLNSNATDIIVICHVHNLMKYAKY